MVLNLPEEKRKDYGRLIAASAKLKLIFGEKCIGRNRTPIKMHLTDEADLTVLPEGEKEAAHIGTSKEKRAS